MNKKKLIGFLMVLPMVFSILAVLSYPLISEGFKVAVVVWMAIVISFGIIFLGLVGLEKLGW